MPKAASRMINVLNHRTSSQLATMGITNRTETISMVKRFLTLRTLVQTLERRSQDMQTDINKFMDKFIALQNRGLPSLMGSSGRLISHENYAKRVNTFATNQIAENPSTSAESGPASGQTLYNSVLQIFINIQRRMRL